MATHRTTDDTTRDLQVDPPALDDNPVARDLQHQAQGIERALEKPTTAETRANLEAQLKRLRDKRAELAKNLARPNVVAGDPYGRTREEIDAETSRLRR